MKRTFIFLCALALAVGLCLVMLTPVAADPGTTYYVSNSGNDETGTGAWDNPWATIQHAVDQVDPGDTIQVALGTYAGAIVDKDVTISGSTAGTSTINTGVPYKVGGAYTTAFRLDEGADGAEIASFTVNNNQGAGFFFAVFAKGVDDVTIDDMEVNDTVQGITNWGGSGWTITSNTITDTVAAGGGGIGIFLGATPPSYRTCSDNLVQYNTIDASATAEDYSCPGIAVCLDTRYGAYEQLDFNEDVSGNQILDNTVIGNGGENSAGVEMGVIGLEGDPDKIAATMGIVDSNTVHGNVIDDVDLGLYFYVASNLTVTENEMTDCGYGLHTSDAIEDADIQDNDFTSNYIQVEDLCADLDLEFILGNNTFDRAVVVRGSGIKVPTIFSSIQDAVDAADPGDTVQVMAGIYSEQVLINKDLALEGAGDPVIKSPVSPSAFTFPESSASWEPVILAFGGTNSGGSISGSETIAVNISSLTVDGNDRVPADRSAGILLRNAGGTVSDNGVQNMYVDGKQTFGIMVYGDSDVVITGNDVSGYARGGIGANGDSTTSSPSYPTPHVVIEDNTVTGPGMEVPVTWAPNGIQIGWGATGEIRGNSVTGNGWPGTAWSGSGIIVAGADGVEVDDNTVEDNETGIAVCGWMWNPAGVTADGTWIHHNTVDGNTYGISIQDKSIDITIEYNTIKNSTYDGIDICNFYGYAPTGTLIRYNTITDNNAEDDPTSGGVWIDDGVDGNEVTINFNEIAGNSQYGILNTGTTNDVDATINWWGDASGPYNATTNPSGAGDSVSDNVDYSPWWGANYVDVSHPWEWYTNDSIQDAVDAASAGDTINVIAGTYIESPGIVIDKNLSVIGAGSTNTTIKPSGDTASRGAMLLINPDVTFHISDVTLDGTGKKVWYALKYQGGGSVTNCEFKNIQYNPSGPDYNGIAICAYGEAYDETIEFDDNVDITGCTFTGIGRVGVLYFGPGITDSTYSGNTYVGKGDGNWLDYALDVGSGPDVTITDSTISDCTGVASSDGSTSAGIMVTDYYKDYCPAYTGTEADITGNDISGCTSGIAVGYDEADVSVATISGNTFEDNTYQVDCTPNVDVDLEATLAGNTFDRAVVVRGSGIKVPTIFSSIQDAIDAAVAGDTVDVAAGTYDEQVTIDKGLSLVGSGADQTFVKAAGSPVVTVSANNVTIQNLEITDDPYLIEGIRVSGASTGLTVDNVDFAELGAGTGANAYGIYIANSFANLYVTDCDFVPVAHTTYYRTIGIFAPNHLNLSGFEVSGSTFQGIWTGIYLRSAIDGLDVTGSTFGQVQSSEFAACVSGIYIGDGDDGSFDIENVTVADNTFAEYGRGVYVWNYANGQNVSNFEIYENTFTDSVWSSAIRFIGGIGEDEGVAFDGINIHDNVFTQHSTVGAHVALIDFRAYCELADCDIAVTDNEIALSGGPYTDPWTGIAFSAYYGPFTNTVVDGNTLNGGNCGGAGTPPSTGVLLKHESSNYWPSGTLQIDITHNEITGFDHGVGIYDNVAAQYGGLPTGCVVDINYNQIYGNALYGVINGNSEMVDATYNWWGDASGPYHEILNPVGLGNAVSDGVLFDPWFADEGMTTEASHSTYRFDYEVPDVIVALEETVVPVTFETDALGDTGYALVRFKFSASGPGDVIFKATDSTNTTHTFTNSGYWGPAAGFYLPADYSATTDWSLNFSEPGEYTITFALIEAPDGEVIAGIEGSEEVTVRAVDIFDYYRRLNGAVDKVDTLDLLAAANDWSRYVTRPGFPGPITTLQLLQLANQWSSGG